METFEAEITDPPHEDGRRVSEAEYMDSYYEMSDRVYEWNNGILEERPPGDPETFRMYDWFYILLREYLKTHTLGELIGLKIGFRMSLPGKTVIRKPDLALILNTNPTPMELHEIIYKGIFDMCFEFLSDAEPWEVERDTVTKKSEYCLSGVREYFILDRKGRETAFYRLRGGFYTPVMPTPDGLICSRVLPGFQFREEDLYLRPSENKMAEDPVYRSFVRKDYQKERQGRKKAEKRAEKADQRAQKADQQARKERQRAEKLAAMLRELGMDAD